MNLYFLVEGEKTEPILYPKWFSYLLPSYTQIFHVHDVKSSNYFLFSGKGQPSLLDIHLQNSIEEINEIGLFDYLVIALDAEEATVQSWKDEINNYILKENLKLQNCQLKIIVQNRCIETWLLGNKKVFPRNTSDKKLLELINFYNVSQQDPEGLPKYKDFSGSIAKFHLNYLKLILKEKNIRYSKTSTNEVSESYYLQELIKRANDKNKHIASFKELIDFCEYIKEKS